MIRVNTFIFLLAACGMAQAQAIRTQPTHLGGGLPQLIPHTVFPGSPFCIGEVEVTPLEVIPGKLPVIVNGDICSIEDMAQALAQSGADGVMIGRGAYGKPWLLGQAVGGDAPGDYANGTFEVIAPGTATQSYR